MDTDDSGPKAVKTTPQIETLELPASLKKFVETVAVQLCEYDREQRRYHLKHVAAFAACLAVANNDPRRATHLLNGLVQGVDDWNDSLRENSRPLDYPIV